MTKKSNKFIVRSDDGKWFATSEVSFTDSIKRAVKFTEEKADEIITSISVMKLEKIVA